VSARPWWASPPWTRPPSQWPARAAELSDLLQYYLYGYKQPTPAEGSVFGQVTIPATTIVNFGAVFDFTTFAVELPAGSYTLNLSTFVISPVMSFVATAPFTAPAGYQSWAVGDTWNTPDHASLLVQVCCGGAGSRASWCCSTTGSPSTTRSTTTTACRGGSTG
jgi:hypothetical protein